MAGDGTGGAAITIGVTGKTGSGQTTVAALLAMALAGRGLRTLAVDTDPSPNLAVSLGAGHDAVAAARPVPRAVVLGRAGGSVTPGQVVRGYGVPTPAGVTVLHAMAAADQAAGCACAAHAPAGGLLAAALAGEADAALLDLETGLDHLDRPSGTLAHVDVLLVVLEPSVKSAVTAGRLVARARAHGIGRVALVGNKAAGEADAAALAGAAADHGVRLAGVVPFTPAVVEADRAGAGLGAPDGAVAAAVEALVEALPAIG